MAGVTSRQGKHQVVRTSSTTLLHERNGATLQITVERRGGHPGTQPLARLALPLVRNRDGVRDPRWAAHTVEEFHQAQQNALADARRQPLDVRIDGVVHGGEAVTVGDDWAAFVDLPAEDFDVELTAHQWPIDDLAIMTITDLDPYIAGARAMVGPLLAPRRPRLNPNRQAAEGGQAAASR